jgi:hypothetical protein
MYKGVLRYALEWWSGDRVATQFAQAPQILIDTNTKSTKPRGRVSRPPLTYFDSFFAPLAFFAAKSSFLRGE